MTNNTLSALESFKDYTARLNKIMSDSDFDNVVLLAEELLDCVKSGRQVFICGNGGSAGNAMHIANDFLYGITKTYGRGLKVHALPANGSVITCLANDEGYDSVFSYQLAVQANAGDVLIVLSGSGNSPNIIKVLDTAKDMGVRSFGVLGYSGGKAKEMADVAIHFAIDDMQISEDLQLITAHMIMQWLYENKDKVQ